MSSGNSSQYNTYSAPQDVRLSHIRFYTCVRRRKTLTVRSSPAGDRAGSVLMPYGFTVWAPSWIGWLAGTFCLDLMCSVFLARERTGTAYRHGFFPVPLGQFTSVTYPRRTGGKRLHKNRTRMRVLLMLSIESYVFFLLLWFFAGLTFADRL